MHKFGNNTIFTPVNNTHKFTPVITQPFQRSDTLSVEQLIKQFERSQSIDLEMIKPEPEYSKIKEDAKAELLKEDDEIIAITENAIENTIEPIIEIPNIYPEETEVNIEHSIQKEIKLDHLGFIEPKLKLIVDETVLNLRKKKLQNGWKC